MIQSGIFELIFDYSPYTFCLAHVHISTDRESRLSSNTFDTCTEDGAAILTLKFDVLQICERKAEGVQQGFACLTTAVYCAPLVHPSAQIAVSMHSGVFEQP